MDKTVKYELGLKELNELYTIVHLARLNGEERADWWLGKIDGDIKKLNGGGWVTKRIYGNEKHS